MGGNKKWHHHLWVKLWNNKKLQYKHLSDPKGNDRWPFSCNGCAAVVFTKYDMTHTLTNLLFAISAEKKAKIIDCGRLVTMQPNWRCSNVRCVFCEQKCFVYVESYVGIRKSNVKTHWDGVSKILDDVMSTEHIRLLAIWLFDPLIIYWLIHFWWM